MRDQSFPFSAFHFVLLFCYLLVAGDAKTKLIDFPSMNKVRKSWL